MPTIAETPRQLIPDAVIRGIAHQTMTVNFQVLRGKGKHRGAQTPEQFYGFRPEDVEEMHFYKQGFGEGVWYRLKGGRVINVLGKASEPERHWYTLQAN
jgi:hypothetical protein